MRVSLGDMLHDGVKVYPSTARMAASSRSRRLENASCFLYSPPQRRMQVPAGPPWMSAFRQLLRAPTHCAGLCGIVHRYALLCIVMHRYASLCAVMQEDKVIDASVAEATHFLMPAYLHYSYIFLERCSHGAVINKGVHKVSCIYNSFSENITGDPQLLLFIVISHLSSH